MKRLQFLRTALALLTVSATLSASAEIPLAYYASLQGKSGAELKAAIYKLVGQDSSISMLSYGSGSNSTWAGFYTTDRNAETNEVIDRYSNDTHYFGDKGSSVSGMNIEHSFPKSWWGGSQNNAYKDLYNLMPCESKINSSKSNYAMGVVTSASTNNGCTKVGSSSLGVKLWEPADQWKGDFARGYMYMATAYQNFTWTGDQALSCLQQDEWPTLQEWAYTLYIAWAKADDVSEMEITRNDAVSKIQGNRNPYVDFPNLMEYVWGDSIEVPFDINTTRKASTTSGGIIDANDTPVEIYADTFLNGTGDCTIENNVLPSGLSAVWSNNSTYGWVGKASTGSTSYNNLVNYAADASLVTPEIDLTEYSIANFSFEHACKWATTQKPEEYHSVYVRTKDGDYQVTVNRWPSGNNWTYYNSGTIDISQYAGQKIRLVFRYTSTTDEASTWEIKNLTLSAMGKKNSTVTSAIALQPDNNSRYPVEYYSTDGRRIDPTSFRGIAIRRQGTSIIKVLLKN
jgi:endonuclease I